MTSIQKKFLYLTLCHRYSSSYFVEQKYIWTFSINPIHFLQFKCYRSTPLVPCLSACVPAGWFLALLSVKRIRTGSSPPPHSLPPTLSETPVHFAVNLELNEKNCIDNNDLFCRCLWGREPHGLVNYIDTKAKCCHLKNLPVCVYLS